MPQAQRHGSRGTRPAIAIAALVAAAGVVAMGILAWRDGGAEPLHEISQPVAVPGDLR